MKINKSLSNFYLFINGRLKSVSKLATAHNWFTDPEIDKGTNSVKVGIL